MGTFKITVAVADEAGEAREAREVQAGRFETLPERIPFEVMSAEHRVSSRNPAGDEYYAERTWRQAACFALDGI